MKRIIFLFISILFFCKLYSADLSDLKFYLFNKSLSFTHNSKLYWMNDDTEILKKGISDYENKIITLKNVPLEISTLLQTSRFQTDLIGQNFLDFKSIKFFQKLNSLVYSSLETGNTKKASYYSGMLSAAVFDLCLWSRVIKSELYDDLKLVKIVEFENIFANFNNYSNSEFFKKNINDKLLFDGINSEYQDISIIPNLIVNYIYSGFNDDTDNKWSIKDFYLNLPEFNNFVFPDSSISITDLSDIYLDKQAKLFNKTANYLVEIINLYPLPDTLPPADVTNFEATALDGAVILNWQNSIDSYKVSEQLLYVNRGQGYEIPIVLQPTVSSFKITGLINEKKYNFRLTLKRPESNETPGVEISTIPTDKISPAKITGLKGISGNEKVFLKWSPAKDADLKFQRIYISETGKDYKLIDEINSDLNFYEVNQLQNKKEYFFKITGIDEVPNESPGEIVSVIPADTTAPEPIENLKVFSFPEKLILKWTPSLNTEKDAVSQIIVLKTEDKILQKINLPIEAESYIFDKLLNDKLYEIEIYLMDESDNKSKVVKISAAPTGENILFKKYEEDSIPFDINEYITETKINIPVKMFSYLDYNKDGITDLVAIMETDELVLLEGENGLNFFNTGKDKNIGGLTKTNLITCADINNDNYVDIILATSGFWEEKIKIFINDKGKKFKESSEELGLAIPGECNYLTVSDMNNDGAADIYFCYSQDKRFKGRTENKFFIQQKNKFTDNSLKSNTGCGLNTLYSVSADFNLDGNEDLYIVNENGSNILYINTGDNSFVDRTKDYNMTERKGIPIVFDYGNDGDYDLLLYYPETKKVIFYENQMNTFKYIKIDIKENLEKYIGTKIIIKNAKSNESVKTFFVNYNSLKYKSKINSFIFGVKNPEAIYSIEVFPSSSKEYYYSNVKCGNSIKLF